MKVFISWSGTKSQEVAVALRDWLPGVMNSVEPFVSSEDIYAGARWETDIATTLDASNFGIVCVTRENQTSPWLNFEVGALAKAVDISRIIPLAVNLKPSDIELPLGQFQAQPTTEDGLRAVVISINEALAEQRLSEELLRTSFEVWWPRLQEKLDHIEQQTVTAAPSVRTDRELLEETLDTVRSMARIVDQVGLRTTPAQDWLRKVTLMNALARLPKRERRILELRYGLEGERPQSLQEIGEALGLSARRIRQLETQALEKLAAVGTDERAEGGFKPWPP
jgi:RNA polymerase sigma factor (sigma-70 family)